MCSVIGFLLLVGIIFLIYKEKQGAPVFMELIDRETARLTVMQPLSIRSFRLNASCLDFPIKACKSAACQRYISLCPSPDDARDNAAMCLTV